MENTDETKSVISQPIVSTDEKPLILVAEDNDSNYLLVSIMLKKEYTIIRAINGIEAIKLFEEQHPRLILMDMKMPKMDGLEATAKIREQDKKLPIIALTAFAFDSDKEKAMKAGCNGFLTKPVNAEELRLMIRCYVK
ncbi:MAG: response regulator [Rikenellaceae bacterium]